MSPVSLWPDPNALGPVTDLYEITMMAGYAASGLADEPAVFELFVRRLPANRSYLVFAGLEQAIGDLLRLGFSDEQVAYVQGLPAFRNVPDSWFGTLREFRFQGSVWAMPEGTVCFAGEPLLRVEAPLAQAQLIETFLLASLSYPTLVASKASRCVQVADGQPLYDFGARRGHGLHSSFLCAGRVPGWFRGHEPRRGGPPAGDSGHRHHGALLESRRSRPKPRRLRRTHGFSPSRRPSSSIRTTRSRGCVRPRGSR